MKAKGLSALLISSSNPDRTAAYYRDVIGIPLAKNSHGGLQEHWECDHQGIHFAILPPWNGGSSPNIMIPSYEVEDIERFLKEQNIKPQHPIMKLDEGKFVVTILDVDGNAIRLWMDENRGQ